MAQIETSGGSVAYRVAGTGDPLMLVSGLAGAGRGWGDQVERFATRHTTIVPDHPGTGESGQPTNGFEIEHHAAAMAEVIRQVGCGPTHVVGSSTGGAIAEVMALDHPDVVRSISLVSAWARSDDFFRHQFAVRKQVLMEQGIGAYTELTAMFLFSPGYFKSNYADVRAWCELVKSRGANAEVMAARIDMILRHDQYDRLGSIAVPTLVLVGREDGCTPIHLSQELAALIPTSELEVLDGGHLIYKENPDEFFQRVTRFVSSTT